jgi:hypothetical protein
MRTYNAVILHKNKLREYYKEKFDCNNKEHVNILISIWKTLKFNKEVNLVDRKWCKIIFQIIFL